MGRARLRKIDNFLPSRRTLAIVFQKDRLALLALPVGEARPELGARTGKWLVKK
jgi:hypothetical protein